jgi:hypothetical protein
MCGYNQTASSTSGGKRHCVRTYSTS